MVLPHSHERVDTGAVPSEALRALVDAVQMANFGSTRDALDAFAAVTVEICGADAAVVLLAEPEGTGLTAHAVHATSPSLAAELAGSRVEAGEETRSSRLDFAFSAPIELDGELAGSLDVLRDSAPFSEGERLLAQLAAGELALVLRALGPRPAETESAVERALVLAGEAFAAGSDHGRGPEHVARLAADAAGAQAAVLWQAEDGELKPAASFGDSPAAEPAALSAARVALDSRSFFTRERIGGAAVVSIRLGEPTVGVLQLVFAEDPDDNVLAGLTTFALRAAQTLRAGAAAREAARELGRSRALLAVVVQATANFRWSTRSPPRSSM